MLFTIVLGALVGAAGLTLIRQWFEASLEISRPQVLTPASFPHLAPPQRRRAA